MQVIEYSLFQPGLFVDLLTHPYSGLKHLATFEAHIDINKRRILALEGGDGGIMSLITVEDFVNITIQAIEYEGEWPVVGGIKGNDITYEALIALVKKVRGKFQCLY